jgi:hypothetical protein
MDQLLRSLLSHDNAIRKNAEEQLKQAKVVDGRGVLSALVTNAGNFQQSREIQLLSCILLRQITIREPSLWLSLDISMFSEMRRYLLVSLGHPNDYYMRCRLCDVICPLAGIKIWPEIENQIDIFLRSTTSMEDVKIGLYLLDKIFEYKAIDAEDMSTILSMALNYLSSSYLEMRHMAAIALLSIMFEKELTEDVMNRIIVTIVDTLSDIIIAGEDAVSEIVSSMERLLHAKAVLFSNVSSALFDRLVGLVQIHPSNNALPSILDLLTALATNKSLPLIADNSRCSSLLQLMSHHIEPVDVYEIDDENDDLFSNLSFAAKSSLETICTSLDAALVFQQCMQLAGLYAADGTSHGLRKAFLIMSVIAEGTKRSFYLQLDHLIQVSISSLANTDQQVVYASLAFVETLIDEFSQANDSSEEDEEEDVDEDVNHNHADKSGQIIMKPIQHLYPDLIPTAISSLFQRSPSSVVMHKSMQCLRLFFNPDICRKKSCKAYAASLLDFCSSLLSNPTIDVRIKQEAASLAGNVSVLSSKKVINSKYHALVQQVIMILQTPIPSHANSMLVRNHKLLQGKCLECFALIGKSVGVELFHNDGVEMMKYIIHSIQSGLDYSDPIASYIMQACARIAGVFGEYFQPYIDVVFPPLLAHVAEPIVVEITEQGGYPSIESTALEDSHSTYQRGIGAVNVRYSSHDILEKETSLRVLYQYCLDIPSFIIPFLPQIMSSVSPLLHSPTASDEIYMISCGILSEAFAIYLRSLTHQSMNPDVNIMEYKYSLVLANQMIAAAVTSMLVGWERYQTIESHKYTPSPTVHVLIDGLREFVTSNIDITSSHEIEDVPTVWIHDLYISDDIIVDCFRLIRDELAIWMQRRFLAAPTVNREDDIKVEDDIVSCLQDLGSWLIKYANSRLADLAFFKNDFLSFLEQMMSSNITSDLIIQIPVLWIIDIIEYVSPLSDSLSTALLPKLLEVYDSSENLISCVYGFGVIAMAQRQQFFRSEQVSLIMNLLSLALNWRIPSLAYHVDSYRAELDDEQEDMLKDNAISTMFKLCIFQQSIVSSICAVDDILPSLMLMLPLTKDLFEARSLHLFFLSLTKKGSVELFGNQCQRLVDVVQVLAKLHVSVVIEHDDSINDKEFWMNQIITRECYLGIRKFIKSVMHGQTPIPLQFVEQARNQMSPSILLIIASLLN